MKNLKQIIRESINDFDWVGDILDSNIEPLVLAIKNRLFDVGDLVRISGSLYHHGTQSMLNLPVNGGLFRVQHFINDHSCRFQLNSEMTLTNNFESLTYFKGEQMAFNGNDKDLYVEVIKKKDINESNDFEWVNDILDVPPTLKEYIDGGELKKGGIYNLKGKWSGYGGTFIPLPEEGIVVEYSDIKPYTNSVTFITKQDFKAAVNYFEGDALFLDIEDDAPHLFVTPIEENNLNESDDFEWVNDIEEPTLKYYIENNLLGKGDVVKLTGYFYNGILRDNIYFSENGTTGVVDSINNYSFIIIRLLDEVRSTLDFNPGDLLAFDDDRSNHIMVEMIKRSVNENTDFEWVSEIPEANWDDDWTPEDLVGKTYKSTINSLICHITSNSRYDDLIVRSRSGMTFIRPFHVLRQYAKNGTIKFINNINENNSFEWVNDIPEANWDNDWTIGDIIGKYFRVTSNGNTFKIIDRENNNLVVKNLNNNIETQIRFKSLREWIKTGYISFYNPDNRNRVVEMDNTLDWLKDMVNDDTETIQFYLDNNLLIEGETYILGGHIFYGGDELYYPVPDFKAIYVGKSNYNDDLLFTILTKYLEIELSDGDIVEIGEEFRVIPREFDYLRIKPLSDNINESDDFEWIEDISEDLNFWRKMGLLGKGKVIKLRGKIYNGTCSSYINLPTEGVIVEVLRVYSDGVLIEFIGRCPTNCEYGDYVPGTTTFIWDDIDGETLFIESTNNEEGLNENNNFDWIEDVLDNGMTLEDYVKNDLLIPGKEYIMTGKFGYYNDDDGIEYSLLPEEGVRVEYIDYDLNHEKIHFKCLTNFMTTQGVWDEEEETFSIGEELYLDDIMDAPVIYLKPIE